MIVVGESLSQSHTNIRASFIPLLGQLKILLGSHSYPRGQGVKLELQLGIPVPGHIEAARCTGASPTL